MRLLLQPGQTDKNGAEVREEGVFMEQSLNYSQQQKLKMTPHLAQAIQVLQLSALELQALVDREYMENPLLEIEEQCFADGEQDFQKTRELLDYFSKDDEKPAAYANDEVIIPFAQNTSPSLEEYVLEQLAYCQAPQPVKEVACYLAGLLDEAGYLPETPGAQFAREPLCSLFPPALKLLQSLEPSGIGARNLKECLQLQAKAQGLYTGLLQKILDEHLTALSENHLPALAKELKVTPQAIQAVQDLIREKFQPKPGIAYGETQQQYIIPDIYVKIINGKPEISFNERTVPQLKINSLYRKADLDSDCRAYIKERLNSALNLIKAIEQRRQTLVKVVEEIVHRQECVFFRGFTQLQPLQMKQIGDSIGVHESTVSRAVANKYMATPFGTIPLKKFFSGTNLSSATGEEIATVKIKARIKALIEQEDTAKPLSDEKITALLKAENFKLSRRTVMKYREQLGFPASSKRKRY